MENCTILNGTTRLCPDRGKDKPKVRKTWSKQIKLFRGTLEEPPPRMKMPILQTFYVICLWTIQTLFLSNLSLDQYGSAVLCWIIAQYCVYSLVNKTSCGSTMSEQCKSEKTGNNCHEKYETDGEAKGEVNDYDNPEFTNQEDERTGVQEDHDELEKLIKRNDYLMTYRKCNGEIEIGVLVYSVEKTIKELRTELYLCSDRVLDVKSLSITQLGNAHGYIRNVMESLEQDKCNLIMTMGRNIVFNSISNFCWKIGKSAVKVIYHEQCKLMEVMKIIDEEAIRKAGEERLEDKRTRQKKVMKDTTIAGNIPSTGRKRPRELEKSNYIKLSVDPDDCKICASLRRVKFYPLSKDTTHIFENDGRPVLDACPNMRELNTNRKTRRAAIAKLCPSCGLDYVDEKHHHETCDTSDNSVRCKYEECGLLAAYCTQHWQQNLTIHQEKQIKIGMLGISYNFSCQTVPLEESDISQHFMATAQPYYTHNSVREMIHAQGPSVVISDKKGSPIFPMGLMYTKDKEVVPYVYDSGASLTSILVGTDGIAFPTAPVDSGEQEWQVVRGIGGCVPVRMVYILVPLVNGMMTKIKAQVVENTLQNQTMNLNKLAAILSRQAKADGFMEEYEEIQCPEYGSKAALMLGRSHEHLAPKPVYTADNGLTLYAGCIEGPKGSDGGGENTRTLCMGGSLLEGGYEEKFSNLWMSIKQPDVIKNVIVEGSKVRAGEWGCQWQDLNYTLDEEAMQIFSKQPDICNIIVHGANRILGSASQFSKNVSDLILDARNYSLSGGEYTNTMVRRRRDQIQENQNFLLQHGLEERLTFVNTEFFAEQLVKKLTFMELYQALTGTPSVQPVVCADCVRLTRACSNCKHLNNRAHILTSIKDYEDDQRFTNCVRFDVDKRILCEFPITPQEAKLLPDNSRSSKKRLDYVVKELGPHQESKKKVNKAMLKYTDNGYLKKETEMTEEENDALENSPYPVNHIFPALAYKKSISSDARICFDASSALRGELSLNQILISGIVEFNMRCLLQWFLTSPFIALADFRSFYQRFKLVREQWNLCHFWWYPDLDINQEPVKYIATVLMFGIIAVPRLTLAGLELIGNTYPEIGRELREQCYVDDLLVHEPTLDECKAKKELVTERCERHGLFMKGWAISGQEPDPEIEEDDGSVSFLGLKYFTRSDEFSFKMPDLYRGGVKKKGRMEGLELFKGSTGSDLFEFYNGRMKFGEQLSRTLSYYDPIGLLSPMIMNFKAANRQACLDTGNQFREYLSPEQVKHVCELMIEMNKVGHFRYKRTKHQSGSEEFGLRLFADAGKTAKQIVGYTVPEVPEIETVPRPVSFFTGRNHLVKSESTIPKEELEAIAGAAEVALEARSNLQGKAKTIFGYSDSKIALGWIKNNKLPLQPHYRRRVATAIRGFTDDNGVLQLYYIKGEKQPADVGTKGIVKAEQISPTSLFFNGPEFLKKSPEQALKDGDIIHLDDPKCLNDKVLEKCEEFKEGLAKKLRYGPSSELLERTERAKELDRLTQGFVQSHVDKTKLMLESCGYLCNPLNMGFRKFVKVHHYVFQFLIKTMRRLGERRGQQKFRGILCKWEDNMKGTIGFSYLCQTDLGDYKAQEKAHRELEDLKSLINGCVYRRKIMNLDTVEMKPWDKAILRLKLDSKVHNPEKLTLEVRILREQFTSTAWYEELIGAESLSDENDEWRFDKSLEQLHGWYRYPGIPMILREIKSLLICPDMLEKEVAMESLNKLLHIRAYIKAYSKYSFTSGMVRQLMRMYNRLVSQYHTFHKLSLQEAFRKCKELKERNPEEVRQEVKAWIDSGMTFNELWLTFLVDKGHKFTRFIGRDLVDDIFPRESIFAQVQLLTCNFFHELLTRELYKCWSEAKIKQFCIERNNKLVSSWRVRSLSQALDVASGELEEGGIPHKNLDPKWHSMIPVGDKSSPLVLSLMMHIHHDNDLNPLGRTKHFRHRGVTYNRFKLYSYVYVPGANIQFTRIMKRCVSCRVRTKEEYHAIIGNIGPEQAILHHGYLHVQIDQYGPILLREDGRHRDLRGKTSTVKVWILSFICLATKHVTFRVLRGMDEKEISHALTRLSCKHQVPKKIYTDSFPSNVKSVSQGQLDLLLRNLAHKGEKFLYEVCSVGNHQAMGAVESRQKILGKFLGSLDVDRKTPVYELEAILDLVEEQINNVPLGVSLESGDPSLAIVTPNMLIGRGDLHRVPMGPIRVPRGFSEIKGSLERKWEEIGNIIQKSVIPELLEVHKGLYEKGDPLMENDIVMFQKKSSNNFLNDWSLGRIKEVKTSSDGKGRVVLLEYKRAKASTDTYNENYNASDYATEDSYRDARDLVKLHPVVSDLDIDLRKLYLELHGSQEEDLKLTNPSMEEGEGQIECEHFSGAAKLSCQTCLLKARLSEEKIGTMEIVIFCRSTRGVRQDILKVELKGDGEMLQGIADNFTTRDFTLRRPKEIVSVGHKYMGDAGKLAFTTQRIEEAIVSRIMAINPIMNIEPVTVLKENEVVNFARNKLYVEAIGDEKVFISKQIDIEEFVNYEFKYPSKEYAVANFPLKLMEEAQSFNLMNRPLHQEEEQNCVYNLAPRVNGCTRACCCHYCCQERCPEPFDGIPWDEETCSGPRYLDDAALAI